MRNPEHAQHFNDVDLSRFGYGGLGGAGAEEHQKTRARTAPEGVKISLHCDNCGAPNVITMDWPETIVISTGNLPPNWAVESGYILPKIGCASCRRQVNPGVTPSEAKRWVEAGLHARFVNPQQVQAIVQQATRGRMR